MLCPFCSEEDTKVVDSRLTNEGQQVRRRRECIRCSERFTTFETVEFSLPRLLKRSGNYVQFSEDKLRVGILKALEKRSVATEIVDKLILSIINKLRSSVDREIQTCQIGEWVMEGLKKIDEVGYVRFASVYKEFKDVEEFQKEIKILKEENEKIHL